MFLFGYSGVKNRNLPTTPNFFCIKTQILQISQKSFDLKKQVAYNWIITKITNFTLFTRKGIL